MPGPSFSVADVLAIVQGVEALAGLAGQLVPLAIKVEPRLDMTSPGTLETDLARMQAKIRIAHATDEMLDALGELEKADK